MNVKIKHACFARTFPGLSHETPIHASMLCQLPSSMSPSLILWGLVRATCTIAKYTYCCRYCCHCCVSSAQPAIASYQQVRVAASFYVNITKRNSSLRHVTRNAFANSDYFGSCLLYTSPSPRDLSTSRMPSSA